jgi:hypothetical protein
VHVRLASRLASPGPKPDVTLHGDGGWRAARPSVRQCRRPRGGSPEQTWRRPRDNSHRGGTRGWPCIGVHGERRVSLCHGEVLAIGTAPCGTSMCCSRRKAMDRQYLGELPQSGLPISIQRQQRRASAWRRPPAGRPSACSLPASQAGFSLCGRFGETCLHPCPQGRRTLSLCQFLT